MNVMLLSSGKEVRRLHAPVELKDSYCATKTGRFKMIQTVASAWGLLCSTKAAL